MFRFEHPEYLFGLLLIPLMILGYALHRKWTRRQLNRLGEPRLITRQSPGLSEGRRKIKFLFLMLSLFFLILGIANPQWGVKRKKVKPKSADIVLALDVSKSMLSNDIPPNRLERAKNFVERLIDHLKGERVGLIFFAGNAFLQMPLTTDYGAAKVFVKTADPSMLSAQGTAIGDAIELAEKMFTDKEHYHRMMIIISDGESHDQGAIEATKRAREAGLSIFTVGVGTPQGGMIPYRYGGQMTYVKDKSGKDVITKLNEKMMIDIAKAADGRYFHITKADDIFDAIAKKLEQLDRRELEIQSFDEYNSYFQYFLIPGLLFLTLFLLFRERNIKTT